MVTSFSGRLVFLEGRKKVLLFVSFRARKASKDSVDVGFFPFSLFALICDVDEETEDTSYKFSAASTSKLLPQKKQNFAFPTSYILPQMRQYRVLIAAILKGERAFFTQSSLPVHPGPGGIKKVLFRGKLILIRTLEFRCKSGSVFRKKENGYQDKAH